MANLSKNACLAFCTVPFESLAVRRILFLLDHVEKMPPSFFCTVKQVGIVKLFSGATCRLSYVLAGNLATLQGIQTFGPDFKGLFLTSVFKNLILPLSLLANARQTQKSWKETFSFVSRGSLNVGSHVSFFGRNLLSNYCLIPGFYARDYCYQNPEWKNTTLPTVVGLAVSSIISAVMNTLLKPFFTGKYPPEVRFAVARKFPAAFPIYLRETVSLTLIFGSSSPTSLSK
jgi:hypothetical protein